MDRIGRLFPAFRGPQGTIRRIFGLGRGRRLLALLLVVVVGAILFIGGINVWAYTNSPQFCGTTCHTMPPEYTAYQISPHARVPCVDCHLGRDIATVIMGRKAGDLMHVVKFATRQFEVPIFVRSMRPARESCERCHWPEKFSDDSVREIKHFAHDKDNTPGTTYLIMKTGGGTHREGRGFGIHWHIENQVWFIATDELKQNIPWVRVVDQEGNVTDYVDIEADLSPEFIASAKKERMDCIDCHNRISHLFRDPETAVDRALALGQISSSIPDIKRKSVEILSQPFDTMDEAMRAIAQLPDYYRRAYPDFFARRGGEVQRAVEALQNTYHQIVFPTMDVSWGTHPNNLGHKDWPGCFRCHDGKHISAQKTSIRLHCNICHTIPAVVQGDEPPPRVSLARQGEPASHLGTNWMHEHRTVFDTTCQSCHDIVSPGASDNQGFCSNVACHGMEWKYAGLNAPALVKVLARPPSPKRPSEAGIPSIPHPLGVSTDCQLCHAPGKVRPMPDSHAGWTNDVCQSCHQPAVPAAVERVATPTPELATPTPAKSVATPTPVQTAPTHPLPPEIPHELEGRAQCLICHGEGGLKPVPADHAGRGNDMCQLCHRPAAVESQPKPPSTATPVPATPSATLRASATPTEETPAPATPTPEAEGPGVSFAADVLHYSSRYSSRFTA